MSTQILSNLKEQWKEFRENNPKVRIRNAAEELGVSEAQLLATDCGENVIRLDVDLKDFLTNEIPRLGRVKAITRNDDVVHERVGSYLNPGFSKGSHVGLFVGEEIDLRIFLTHWALTFSVRDTSGDKPRHSIQFFDKYGNALHKIYLTHKSNLEAFENITKSYASENQSAEQPVEEFIETFPERNGHPDRESFQEGWKGLKDTHDFHPLLRKHKLTRLQALELAPEHMEDTPSGKYAVKVSNNSLRKVLTKAAETETPIMVFVGNKGLIQIHTGPVKKLLDFQEWFNVMDPDFNLHVKENAIHQTWVVRKPTSDGMVSSLEIFDKNEVLICTLFGKRKPGIEEDPAWTKIVDDAEKGCL
jgi:putative hemin transport protein